MSKQLQQLLAEVFGTFVLVFIGATAVVAPLAQSIASRNSARVPAAASGSTARR